MNTHTQLVNVMSRHIGADNGISAERLAQALKVTPRQLRRLIAQARERHAVAICGTPSSGYYMASNAAELQATLAFLRSRAMHSLRALRVMRKTALPTLQGQLLLAQG